MDQKTQEAMRRASLAGRQARVEGISLMLNPYLLPGPMRNPKLAPYWEAGWIGADLELAHGATKDDVRGQRFLPR